jgi:four helix bundle protein
MRNFKEIKAWQKAHSLALKTYTATAGFPRSEMFGLTSQMRRSASSIGANIAEGCGRKSKNELGRFMLIAMGSASELECHLLLAHDLGFLRSQEYSGLEANVTEVKRMLTAYIQTLKTGLD